MPKPKNDMTDEFVDALLGAACALQMGGASNVGILARLRSHPEHRPERCPTCNSHAPNLHPAVQYGGEVQVCADPWHTNT